MEFRELPQKMQVMRAPGRNVVEIIAGRDCGTGHKQQDLLEGIDYPPWLAVVLELGKVLQKQSQMRTRNLTLEDGVHDGAPMRIRASPLTALARANKHNRPDVSGASSHDFLRFQRAKGF